MGHGLSPQRASSQGPKRWLRVWTLPSSTSSARSGSWSKVVPRRFPVLGGKTARCLTLELPEQAEHQNSGFVDLSRLTGAKKLRRLPALDAHRMQKAVRDEQVYLSATGHLFPMLLAGADLRLVAFADGRRDPQPNRQSCPPAWRTWICVATALPGGSSLDAFFSAACGAGLGCDDASGPAVGVRADVWRKIDTHSRQWDGPPVPPAVQNNHLTRSRGRLRAMRMSALVLVASLSGCRAPGGASPTPRMVQVTWLAKMPADADAARPQHDG